MTIAVVFDWNLSTSVLSSYMIDRTDKPSYIRNGSGFSLLTRLQTSRYTLRVQKGRTI